MQEDIQQVIDDQWQEGSQLELKEALPSKNKDGDPWLKSQEVVGDRARNEIVAELVAFANAHGGTLILGIAESVDKPSRAVDIAPLPACHELADRLKLMCRDGIEPKLALIDAAGVPTGSDGEGVVVIHVPQSRGGPHRHVQTRECYVRRVDRTEKMTMREIQDLTLFLERGIVALENRFAERKQLFHDTHATSMDKGDFRYVAFRATLVPLADIYIDRVHGNAVAQPAIRTFPATIGAIEYEITLPFLGSPDFRPILRGTRVRDYRAHQRQDLEYHCDGFIELGLVIQVESEGERNVVDPGWFMGFAANALVAAERFRRAAGAPEVEFGLEIELWVRRGDVDVPRYRGHSFDTAGTLQPGRTIFPRYSVSDPSKFTDLCAVIEQDFWDHVGLNAQAIDSIQIDFSEALR